ncbi:unnamed protein product [marine sediment metagenome]|uniref:Uncharacterized protein n=1 Tax=marine sediment metagenome TaxID=412755 RepID=X1GMG4_9ZZZZ
MKQTRIRPISEKRKAELEAYYPLVDKLRELCNNRSELSGKWAVEPHHITGRNGKRLLDPFNILLVTRVEHDTIWKYSKEELLARVRKIRIEQGFKED